MSGMLLQKIKKFYIKTLNPNVTFDGDVNIIGKLPYIKSPKNGSILFGNNVTLNSDFENSNTALTYRCKFVTGYEGKIIIGKNSMFNGVCVVAYEEVEIGKNCQIASSTMIADTNFHPVNSAQRELQVTRRPFKHSSVKNEKIKIGDNVWVGWNCTILKGVNIGDNSIVAAGSIVLAGEYPPNTLIAGNPAKIIKNLD
jgi:acetyltransferase-like isoleucine patch superfamily enzyme